MNYKDKTVCVIDCGLFIELAALLAKSFGKVYYYSEWVSSFPKSNTILVGKGIPGVTRIDAIWKHVQEIDLFVFPDVYQGPLQIQLEMMGKRVWGARLGEDLELNRVGSKEHMKKIGIDIGPYTVVKGIDALREHLKKNKDQFVKISRTRGDMETFHSKNYKLIEPRLDELEHSLGEKKRYMEFVCEDAINDAVEIGYDGYTIDGQFAKKGTWGVEIKDKAFVMKTQSYDSMPKAVTDVNEKLVKTFKSYRYRGFYSSELRLTKDGKAFMIDPCARMGSPPGELMQIMFKNLPEILWNGAEGKLVEPEFAAPWGAEVLIHSPWADKNWQAVEFPADMRDNVKLRNLTIMGGKYYVVPHHLGLPEIGAVVALGDTMQEAIDSCKELAAQVEGYFVSNYAEGLDAAQGEFDKLSEFGIHLSGEKTKPKSNVSHLEASRSY
jgi:hypothetical protein